jgi:hypothetical protein
MRMTNNDLKYVILPQSLLFHGSTSERFNDTKSTA